MGPRPFDSAAANASAAQPADGWIAPDGAAQPRAASHAMAAAHCGTTAPPVAHPATQPELCELCRGVVAAGEACCEPGCGCGAGAMHRACFEAATGFEECEPWMELVLEAGVIDACIDAWSLVGDVVDRLQDATRASPAQDEKVDDYWLVGVNQVGAVDA